MQFLRKTGIYWAALAVLPFVCGLNLSAISAPPMVEPPHAAELQKLLDTIRAVDSKGAGHVAAAAAWLRLAQCNAQQLPAVLAGLDGANPLAANWIRAAAETIVDRRLDAAGSSPRDLASSSVLPYAELERFVLDTGHDPRARRMAYEWLLEHDPAAQERIIPNMLGDSSLEMRRDAVALLIKKADGIGADKVGDDKENTVKICRRALAAARDSDQLRLIVERLKKMGEDADLPRAFGFVVDWKVAGPWDNTNGKGFDAVFPPETQSDFSGAKTWTGKHGPIKVADVAGKGDRAEVDFNAAIVEEKDVVAYAASRFLSDQERPAQLRVTTLNAVKVWLNGELIAAHKVYHGGERLDQYVCAGVLRKGENTILVKICQNDQTQEWARDWHFCLRVCDKLGGPVLSTDR